MVVGGGARVIDYPAVQMRVGRAGAALKAAKALIFDQMEQSRRIVLDHGDRLNTAQRIDNRIAQSFAVQLALQGLDELWGAAGGGGIRNAEVVQRAWRDAHAVAHHVSFNWDVVSAMYGQQVLGLDPQGLY
jgi:resorcinol 4-hydroxylase (FADH2)